MIFIPWRNGFVVKPEGDGAKADNGFVVNTPVGSSERLRCHGTACVARIMGDFIRPFSKGSIFSTRPCQNIKPLDHNISFLI
jgi:hypothetical protein